MSKHTYGFSSNNDREECKKIALEKARLDGFIANDKEIEIELIETSEHIKNNEFCVVIRTPE